jgi:tetratricopeptide (TPR) repeat protein
MRRISYFLAMALGWMHAQPTPVVEARQHPESFRANHLAGEWYLQQHDFAAAAEFLEIAWKLDRTDYTNGYDLALVYLQTGATPQCRQVLTTLLKHADTADLHNLLGDLEEAEKHTDEAARQYETAARMAPTEKNLFDLGSDLLKHNGYEAAFKVFNYGVQLYPHSSQMLVSLGIAHYSLGQYDKAVETLDRAIDGAKKGSADERTARNFLGKMAEISPHYAQETERRMALFASDYPGSAEANYYYAICLRGRTLGGQANADNAKAETLLLNAMRLNPQLTDAHYQLGLLYEDTQQDAGAIREYEVAIRQRPNFSKAHYRLARLYLKTGKKQLATREFSVVETLKAKEQ